jgi:hypothetical protein
MLRGGIPVGNPVTSSLYRYRYPVLFGAKTRGGAEALLLLNGLSTQSTEHENNLRLYRLCHMSQLLVNVYDAEKV